MALAARAADAALLKKLTPRNDRIAQTILPAASAAADDSRVWLGTAAVLAAAGGRRGRRAAVEGVIAIGAASLLVNSPLKQIARRPRPGRGITAPFIKTRGRKPRTSSMPSGHATAAAAFTIAAGWRVPVVAAPLAGAAALVAWSRINAGRHYATDVIAGAAAGAVVACGVHVIGERIAPADDTPPRGVEDAP